MLSSSTPYERAVTEQRVAPRETAESALDRIEIVRLATLAASSHNSQPWIFRPEKDGISILPDFSRRCPVVDPDDSHLFKSLGCAAENVVHAAAAQCHAAHVTFEPASQSVRIILEHSGAIRAGALSHAIPQRQCTKLPYDGRPLDTADLSALEAAGSGDGVRALLIDDAPTRDGIVDCVRRGNVAQLSDSAFRKELVAWLRFNDASAVRWGDGLSTRAGGQPSLPDWLAKLMLPFVLTGKSQADTDEKNIRSSPHIAVFVAGGDKTADWVEVGRVYERFALQATALGIRSAFINQPIEVKDLRPELNSLLGLRHETALLMLRIGYGPLAPFSLRRPVEDVIVRAEGAA